ncbi:AbrB/MazE/SpoVT family DNA-binding domain-containing protein [Candidatus Woesearchaeota archaeon]|nr:AbrB/MazE/SpoVT family DNA-binding domain-containing protein [Candidatus Woesearchaeota archaeon]
MVEIQAKTRKWGSSIGVVLPKALVEEAGIKPNEKIVIEIKKRPLAKDFFGLLKDWKRPTQEIKDEMRAGWMSASDILAEEKSKK